MPDVNEELFILLLKVLAGVVVAALSILALVLKSQLTTVQKGHSQLFEDRNDHESRIGVLENVMLVTHAENTTFVRSIMDSKNKKRS